MNIIGAKDGFEIKEMQGQVHKQLSIGSVSLNFAAAVTRMKNRDQRSLMFQKQGGHLDTGISLPT